ncbi:hypothetical protein AB0K11_22180 [Mycobacterium sp. NPDC050551]|uniref:hypothetical protein n=1 Tax=Mycobacterium sp. NPDC050551 TaxID=3155407 RepID=UPI00343E9594
MEPHSARSRASAWRDPLSVGWSAHRQLLMLRLRWHERRYATPTAGGRWDI